MKRGRDLDATLALASEIASQRGAARPASGDFLAACGHADSALRLLGDDRVRAQAARTALMLGDDAEALIGAEDDALRVAEELGAPEAHAGHLLAALVKNPEAHTRAALRDAGCDVPAIQARLVRETVLPRRRSTGAFAATADPARRPSQAPPVGRLRTPDPTATADTPNPAARRVRQGLVAEPTTVRPRRPTRPPVEDAPSPTSAAGVAPAIEPRSAISPLRAVAPRSTREAPRDLLVGRAREVERVLDALGKRETPLPCLVGEPGVGKTTLGLGVAASLGKPLVRVDLRAERPATLAEDVAARASEVVYFLDGIEAAAGDAALLALLARADVPCLLSATPAGLRALFEAQPALERRLEVIVVPEPDEALLAQILAKHAALLAQHHGVRFDPGSVAAATRLGPRHLAQRVLPDKAIALLDLAGARAHRRGDRTCTAEHVVALIADATGVPSPRLLMDDGERLLRLEADLGEHVVGHDDAHRRIAEIVRRNYAGFRGRRPIGTFLFLGPMGVGKTEMAKALAKTLMGDERALVRLDMSEYAESHAVARLVGAPPGYVGHEEGGQLTDALRARPYRVVLLDEIERAHRDVQELLLQVLDEARLTDGRGRTVDFSNAVVVMTSNLGAEEPDPACAIDVAKRAMPIELWNRIDEPLAFAPLERAQVAEVARRLARRASAQLEAERGIAFSLTEDAITFLLGAGGYDRELGARPMRGALARLVEAEIADRILRGELVRGARVTVGARAGELVFDAITARPPARAAR